MELLPRKIIGGLYLSPAAGAYVTTRPGRKVRPCPIIGPRVPPNPATPLLNHRRPGEKVIPRPATKSRPLGTQ
jgi:hypothetical protein